jgi:hypothetical protein
LVLELPSDKLGSTPQFVFMSPKGVRFDTVEAALQHIARVSPPVALTDPTTALDADSDTVRLPNLSLTTASYFDDWLHRGSGNILSTLPWYVYAIWVYRAERLSPSDPRSGQFLDVDFAPHYKLSEGYVQRLSLNERVPQPEGMTLPTESQNPNGNAMYKSLLFRSFHASPMDPSTGETPDPFLCLHTSQEHPSPASPVEARSAVAETEPGGSAVSVGNEEDLPPDTLGESRLGLHGDGAETEFSAGALVPRSALAPPDPAQHMTLPIDLRLLPPDAPPTDVGSNGSVTIGARLVNETIKAITEWACHAAHDDTTVVEVINAIVEIAFEDEIQTEEHLATAMIVTAAAALQMQTQGLCTIHGADCNARIVFNTSAGPTPTFEADTERGHPTDAAAAPRAAADVNAQNPFESFSSQWRRYWRDTVLPEAAAARAKLQSQEIWPSLWETCDVWEKMMELAEVGPFEDEDLSLEAAQAAVDYLVSGRLTVQEYACLIVHRSAQNLEAQALARVAPKVRREAWAKDAEEDSQIRRMATEHDGEAFDYDFGDDEEPMTRESHDMPDKPADVLTEDRWAKAWQFHRKWTSKFVKDMHEWGLLREIAGAAQLPTSRPPWANAQRQSLDENRRRLHNLPCATQGADFQEKVVMQYEHFKTQNMAGSPAAIPPAEPAPPLDGGGVADAEARFEVLATPLTEVKRLISSVERDVEPHENRKKITLTRGQCLACAHFAQMVDTAWREEREQVAWDKRTTQHMVLLGQGGTGKTMLVQEIFIPLVEWAFPADEHGDRWLVVAYSHAQADAISKGKIRARTLHNACAMRVQSLANTKMAPGAKKETLIRTWGNKVFLVDEEISMMPAEALNMEMYRAAWGRSEKCGVEIDSYAEKE